MLSRNSSFDSIVASYEDIRGSSHAISPVSKTGSSHQGICLLKQCLPWGLVNNPLLQNLTP